MDTYNKLIGMGFVPEKALCARKIVSVTENNMTYVLPLKPEKGSCVFPIDNYIIKSGERCDKLVLIKLETASWYEVYVELKGKKVLHAISQLEATLNNQLFKVSAKKNRRARIVAVSCPRSNSDPMIEKKKLLFKTKYHCELRVLRSRQPDDSL